MSKGKSLVCLKCFTANCEHTGSRPPDITPRQLTILKAILDPRYPDSRDIAAGLGVEVGSLKVYLSRLYRRLGWKGRGSTRQLALWAVAHAGALGLTLPTPKDFEPSTPAAAVAKVA